MLAITPPLQLPALPTLTTRPATLADLPFIDGLQKQHSRQLGFFPRAQIEGYVANGWMRIAEDGGERVGYVASRDRYLKRDELGAVFQLCVEPGRQRGLIGATLLQSAFDAAAYGCKLFCCWCAQDLAANRFWEALGFVPIAYRAGSEKKSRVHIFWQKRIRSGDTATPWWFPSQTAGGAMGAERIVLPMPAGTHWSEAKPMILPGQSTEKALPAPRAKKVKTLVRPADVPSGGFYFPQTMSTLPAVVEKPKREPKAKHDPRLIAAARELRDRWLEQANALPTPSAGKYDVAKQIAGDVVDGEVVAPPKRLAA